MTLEFAIAEDVEITGAGPETASPGRIYEPPVVVSGLAFEPVLAATCTNDDPEDEDCSGSPPECF